MQLPMELSSELLFFYPPFLLPACLLACAAVGMSILVDSKPLHLCGPDLSENSLIAHRQGDSNHGGKSSGSKQVGS